MMTINPSNEREQLEMLTIDQIVPEDHFSIKFKETGKLDMASFLRRTRGSGEQPFCHHSDYKIDKRSRKHALETFCRQFEARKVLPCFTVTKNLIHYLNEKRLKK